MPELEDRVTVKVENMRKTADLPHMCEKQQIWTQMKSNLMEGNLLESATTKGYHSTGRWGLQRKEKCHPEKTCLVCGTAPLDEAPPKDQQILREAQEKHEKTRCKKLEKLKVTEEIEKNREQTETTPTSFAAASLGTFKSTKVRRVALSARSGITDRRAPREDQNSWKDLISSRRGYMFAARTIHRIILMFKRKGSKSVQKHASTWSQALVALFSSERPNSYATLETRRGNPQFKVVESLGILLIQGRRIQEGGSQTNPSTHQQTEHLLFGEGGRQQTSYCVPILSPHSALGIAVAETLHDKNC